jgi:FKBP-type peptidyl-prolyl cis-trans isomerase 2
MPQNKAWNRVFCVFLAGMLCAACAALKQNAESPKETAPAATGALEGDLVMVRYTGLTTAGEVFTTTGETLPENAVQTALRLGPSTKGPVPVVAGKDGGAPGVAHAVLGLRAGENASRVVPPEKAFGPRDPGLVRLFPRIRKEPSLIRMEPREFTARLNAFPVAGQTVSLNPYFPRKILSVTPGEAVLEAQVRDGAVFNEPFGKTTVRAGKESVEMELEPKPGAPFILDNAAGRIASADAASFTVDFNHPMAGESVTYSVSVVSVTSAEEMARVRLPWQEDYDKGMAAAMEARKPVVLVLYAAWCSWSKKLMAETMEDPRVKARAKDFEWVRADSWAEPDLKDYYGQTGFPMIVLMDGTGEIVEKVDGYTPPEEFLRALESFPAKAAGQ